jgi:hypothetical protein
MNRLLADRRDVNLTRVKKLKAMLDVTFLV